MEKNIKQLFDTIGLEKPSEDFTSLVMNKIESGFAAVPVRKSFVKKYSFILIYLMAFLIVIPFAIPAMSYIFRIDIQFNDIEIDIAVIREWFERIITLISYVSISPAIIISIACFILLSFFAFETYAESRGKTIY